jgi:hypothetical protein
MSSLKALPSIGVMVFLLVGARVESQPVQDRSAVDLLLRRAVDAANSKRYPEALQLYQQLERSSHRWYSWAGTSGLVVVHRMAGAPDAARTVTERVAAERPRLAGLMAIWDGDTAMLEGDVSRALAAYRRAADVHGRQVVDGKPIGAKALRQLSRAYLELRDARAAAQAEREILANYPRFVDRELVMANVLVFEAMASGQLPLKPVEKLLHDGDCSSKNPCVVDKGRVLRTLPSGAVRFSKIDGLYFLPDGEVKQLRAMQRAASDTFTASSTATVCTTPTAQSGFQSPMAFDGYGYHFMDNPDCCSGYHTGADLNRGGYQADCNDDFYAAADGCVRDVMASTTDWGSAAVEHYYRPSYWTSQYGHAYSVEYSVDQAIGKGAWLGDVGGTGSGGPDSFACHLHFEIREQDHSARNNASSYHNTPQSKVADEYQDPIPFITAHKAYQIANWIDEHHFTTTGTWNAVSDTGDMDDMKWAATTATKTNYAQFTWQATGTGTWEIFAFVPYKHQSSTKVPYRLVRSLTGVALISTTVDQSIRKDSWVRLGSAALTARETYVLEVATNTGESNRRVALDDFLMILPPGSPTSLADLRVSGITFTATPTAGVRTTAVAQLANVGQSPSGVFNVKWFLDGAQVGYGSHTSLAPGQTSSGNVRFDWTPTAGTHRLRFVADTDGHVRESNEANNAFEVTVTVAAPPPKADLQVSGIGFTSTPSAGVRTTAIAQLANVGQSSSGAFNVKWFLDGAQVGYGSHTSLSPGQVSSGNVRFDWTPTAGTHTLRFQADVDNHVSESNESNNSFTRTVSVSVQSRPDLQVSGISFTVVPRVGVRTTAIAQLANVGQSPSGAFNVKWFVNGSQVGYGSHASLAPGEVSSGNVRFDWTPSTPGTYILRFQADVDGHVSESNEANNGFDRTVTVSY